MSVDPRVRSSQSYLSPPRAALGATLWISLLLLQDGAGCSSESSVDLTPVRTGTSTAAQEADPAGRPWEVQIIEDEPGFPVQTRDGRLDGSPIPPADLVSRGFYRRILHEILSDYPPRLLQRIGLRSVVLCDNLSFEGTNCFAYAVVERGCLYLSIRAGLESHYVRRTFHHEIFHQVDYADDHQLASDPRWEALNPRGFRYSGDAERLQADPNSTLPDESLEGFLNRYGTSAPAEDKAELYASLMVDRAAVRRREARDAVIRRKVERLRQTLDGLGHFGRALFDP